MSNGYGGESMVDYEEQINWEEVGVPVAIGKYNFVVEKAEYTPSKTNKHMVKAQLKIDGFDPATPALEPMMGRTVFVNFNFSQAGGFTVKGFASVAVNAEGEPIDLPRVASKAHLEEWAHTIVGARVAATIKHRLFNEQLQADIAKWFEPMEVSNDVEDNTGGDEPEHEEEEENGDHQEEEEQEPEVAAAPPTPPQRSLREAVPATKAAKPHTNGTAKPTNGKPASKVNVPAKKTASKR